MALVKGESGLWVYKCNRTHDGAWEQVFTAGKRGIDWGGSHSIKNKSSLDILNHRMKVGDTILSYQTDELALIGTCRVTKLVGRHPNRVIWLKPIERFLAPIPIHDLKQKSAALRKVRAFQQTVSGTLYAVSPDERQTLERLWQEPAVSLKSANGAGFGDPESNKLVETAAIEAVTRFYERKGWDVDDLSDKKCGYDLRCSKSGRPDQHVEVKGVSGSIPLVIITPNEKSYAQKSSNAVVCIVTDARSKRPKINRMTGSRFLSKYSFEPVAYFATPKDG